MLDSCELSAKKITNQNFVDMGKLESNRISIADFNPEWAFAHHAYIAFYKKCWYIAWSSGKVNEDDLGQRIMFAKSYDFFNWSEPRVLMDSYRGIHSDTVLSFYGFYEKNDKLYAYITMQEFKPEVLRENGKLRPDGEHSADVLYRHRYVMSTADGENWTDAVRCEWGGGTQCVALGKDGREFFFDMTDAFYNDSGNPMHWEKRGLSSEQISSASDRGATFLCEAAGFLGNDGILRMLNRSNAGRLWLSESYDNGDSWTDSYPTEFLVESSQFNVGRLPDKRLYIICNGQEHPCWSRKELYIYISDDGFNFNKRYTIRDEDDYKLNQPGLAKGGAFAYPTTVIRDGYIYISYTKQKEAVEVTRIPLAQILK